MEDHEISKLVDLADTLVYKKTGQYLDAEEKNILRQSLKGKKLSAIRCFGLTGSYVQRGLAQRLWQRLSEGLGEKVGKRNVLKVLQKRKSQQTRQQTQSGTFPPKRRQVLPQSELNGHSAPGSFLDKTGHPLPTQTICSATPTTQRGCPVLSGDNVTQNISVSSRQVSYCTNAADCINHQNPHHLCSCQVCSTRLLMNGQMHEPSQAEHPEDKKAEDGNSDGSKSNTDGWPTLMKVIKPGVPLLLSIGVLGCSFGLSWLANWYGLMNHWKGQLPQAQLGYKIALSLNPLSAEAHYNQGVAEEDKQNYERAFAEYQMAIEGGLIEAYNNQARLYILSGKYDAAVSLLKIGLPLVKNEDKLSLYSFLKNLGWARLELGQLEKAKVSLTEAIKLENEQAPAYCLLAQLLERQGMKEKALGEWENCLRFSSGQLPEEDKWIRIAQQRLKGSESEK